MLTGLALLVAAPKDQPVTASADTGAAALRSLAARLGPMGRLGPACRAALPAPARGAAALAASLLERLGPMPATALGAVVRQDFAAGRMRVVEGWLLADTEVRLLAWSVGAGDADGRAVD